MSKQKGKRLNDVLRERVFDIARDTHSDDADVIRSKALNAYQWREYPEALDILSSEWQRNARGYVKVYKLFRQYFDSAGRKYNDATPDFLKALIVVCRLPSKLARKFHDEVLLNDVSLHYVHTVQPLIQKIVDQRKSTKPRQPSLAAQIVDRIESWRVISKTLLRGELSEMIGGGALDNVIDELIEIPAIAAEITRRAKEAK